MPRAFVVISIFLAFGCVDKPGHEASTHDVEHKQIPASVALAIEKQFPGALPYHRAVDSILAHISHLGITPDQILWGQSTCVDDITNTKNKLAYSKVKGPFSFGGLGGLPFTGITGVNAFAHHLPEDGTALLFVGPHIGYSSDGWGKLLRHGQHHSTNCCGALVAALKKLQSAEIIKEEPTGDDYQEKVIEQLALDNTTEILEAPEPLVALTLLVNKDAQLKMTRYAGTVHDRHFAYAVLVAGVIINTDYQYDDYLWINHIAIKDIKEDKWIENMEAPTSSR